MSVIIPTADQALRIVAARFGLSQRQVPQCFTEHGMIFEAIKGAHGLNAAIEWQRAKDLKSV